MSDTLSGAIRQSYNDPEKYQGCKHCNPNHPEYDELYAVQTNAKGIHYITKLIIYYTETGYCETEDREIDTCPACGRKL